MNIMEQNTLKKNMWDVAGIAGLALGTVSTVYLFAGQWLAGDLAPAVLWQQVVAMILWAVKLVVCIWLMKFFMTRFASEHDGIDNKTVFRMGMMTALLSAVMYSAIYLANMLYISADFYERTFQTMIQQMSPVMDSNSLTMMEKLIGNMPQLMFFYNIIYCFLFGTVLSAILSRSIPAKFAEYKQDEQ